MLPPAGGVEKLSSSFYFCLFGSFESRFLPVKVGIFLKTWIKLRHLNKTRLINSYSGTNSQGKWNMEPHTSLHRFVQKCKRRCANVAMETAQTAAAPPSRLPADLISHKNSGNSGMLECFRPQTGANSRFWCEVVINMEKCEFLWRYGETSVMNHHGSPTFGGSGSAQVIDGSQDEPQGLLLLTGHSQDLHGSLEFGELLSSSLLLLGLQRPEQRSKVAIQTSIHPIQLLSREKFGKDLGGSFGKLTLECGRIPKALFSARWLKCSSVLRGKDRNVQVNDSEIQTGRIHEGAVVSWERWERWAHLRLLSAPDIM